MAFSTGRRSLTTLISRALSHKLSPSPPSFSSSLRARFALAALAQPPSLFPSSTSIPTRFKSTGGHSPLDDPSPNWSNRPPKETILLDGCDYEHWLVVLEFPRDKPKPSSEEMINAYVKTLAEVVGSEEEAMKKIYSVSTTTYTGFGCLVSEELSYKLKEVPGVLWVLPDSYLDVPNKDYGGDIYDNGKVTRRPQYDFSQREPTRTRNRPRHDNRRDSRPVERRGPPQSQGNQTQPQSNQQRTPMEASSPLQAGAAESTGV